ncbi:MAG: hypothetical protein ACKO4T_02195, partial [Planctomycetaceae bacterium]
EKACAATEWKEAHIISTLAAGHAEKGDFETAKKYSRQAVEADAAEAGGVEEQLRAELAAYELGKPWRERQEMPEGGESGGTTTGRDAAQATPAEKPAGTASDKPAEAAKPAATAASDAAPRRPFDD